MSPHHADKSGEIRLQYVLGSGGFFSRLESDLIEWYGRAYSHVDSVLPAGYGYAAGSLIGARSDWISPVGAQESPVIPPGVQVRPAGYAAWRRRTVYSLRVSKAQQDAYYRGVLAERRKPYDHIGILGFLFPPSGGRDWRDPSAWFCDELVVAKLEEAKVVPRLSLSASQITPGGSTLVITAIGAQVVEDEVAA